MSLSKNYAPNRLNAAQLDEVLNRALLYFPFVIAANPSSQFPPKKERHYEFLKVLWRLNLVSLESIARCADALQERTATIP